MSRKILGVIGGVGPLSTAYFMEVIIKKTDVLTDQEHIDMVILNHTEIPDRTDYILDNTKPNPIPFMVDDAIKLEKLGAHIIVTPCNTAHYFYNSLSSSVSIPIINMIDETALYISSQNVNKVGILATTGTIKSELFQQALNKYSITPVIPNDKNQEYVMDLIYKNIKSGVDIDNNKLNSIIKELENEGCQKIILGCTELSILKTQYNLDDFYIDALEVLAIKAILACDKKVKS